MLNRTSSSLMLLSIALLAAGCQTYEREPVSPTAIGLDADVPGIQDRIFVQDALAAGREEIQMALLGVQRAGNLDLQLLAQRLFDDHTQANRDLEIIARQEQIPIVATKPATAVTQLSHLSGSGFDEIYLEHMMEAHESDIKKFEAAARNARSRDIRGFAARTLPALREHLRIAQNIQRQAGLGRAIIEPAGAQVPSSDSSPFYQGDAQRRHQFNPEK